MFNARSGIEIPYTLMHRGWVEIERDIKPEVLTPIAGLSFSYQNSSRPFSPNAPILVCHFSQDRREVPNPLYIDVCRGKSEIDVVLNDLLALTKLNYNTCIFADGVPVTLLARAGG